MAMVNASNLEQGMILASDLKDRTGRFILGKGVTLTPKQLKIIKMWGVTEADVAETGQESEPAKPTIEDAHHFQTDDEIRHRFLHADLDHPLVQQLFEICLHRQIPATSTALGAVAKATTPGPLEADDESAGDPKVAKKIDPQALIQGNIKLPSLPVIFSQINAAISDPRSSAVHLGNIINRDTGLSARLLRIVNSAFYGFPSKIDTISRAVTIIGTKELNALTLGTCALSVFDDIPSDLIDMKSFWKHSVACGVIARMIASYKNKAITERCFIAGLLHDVGRLIFLKSLPLQAKTALFRARQTDSLLYTTEEEIMGFDHTVIGGLLLKKWGLPITLENAVKHHHGMATCQDPLEPAIVHVADIITNALGIGTSGEQFVPPLDTTAWEAIGLSPSILGTTIQQADRHIEEVAHILFSK